MDDARVCVIIAAWNAASTIGAAIRSALVEPEVTEVIVVDDASSDDTTGAARAADDGTGRLQVIRLDANGGPSRARNIAIAASTAPYLAILDADDAFLPGRCARLFVLDDWEMAADNIVLVAAAQSAAATATPVPDFIPAPQILTLAAFVDGNVTRAGVHRQETGLLKPVISRAFLDRVGLRYDEGLRLGEDFVLYTRLMARGARFLTIRTCGYRAIQRQDSLSNSHRTDDLRNLADAARDILSDESLDLAARIALIRQERLTRAKYRHRAFLDIKARDGLTAALRGAGRSPIGLWQIATGIARDKLRPLRALAGLPSCRTPPSVMRFLMDGRPR